MGSDTSYDQNDTIPVYHNASGSDSIVSDGFFSVPAADFSGHCNDNNYAQFQVPVTGQVCRRSLGGEQGCLHSLSSLAYTSLLIAATP